MNCTTMNTTLQRIGLSFDQVRSLAVRYGCSYKEDNKDFLNSLGLDHPKKQSAIASKQFRMKHGITRVQMASIVGVTATAIGQWERGIRAMQVTLPDVPAGTYGKIDTGIQSRLEDELKEDMQ